MPSRTPAPDQIERDRISSDLGTTLFVEAGAGSGKTTALVDRVLALVIIAGVPLRSIAAITFTDKAGAELRDRVRRELETRAIGEGDDETKGRCRTALDELDGAAIGTLHAFAQRLLTEHPIEAGLPPRVEVLDEVSSGVAFDQRWAGFQDELLSDPTLERTLLLLLATGVKENALRALAIAFDDNWDLVEERVPDHAPEPPRVKELLRSALADVHDVCGEPCRDPDDLLRKRLDEIAAYAKRLSSLDDEVAILEALDPKGVPTPPGFRVGRPGSQKSFDCDIKELKARCAEAGTKLDGVRVAVGQACAARLGAAIRRFTLGAAAERQRAGLLEFHDLLVLARSLLRNPEHGAAVRTRLHERYERLLLDEFQDTDPIQIELAVRIAAAQPASDDAGAAPWDQVPVSPGHLFVVGDPKQSIYRFRRADISTFLTAAKHFGVEGGGVVELTANFRTASQIVEWANTTFAALMSEPPGVDLPGPSQPHYTALQATRINPTTGASVAVIGRDEHPKGTKADPLREAEAADVASTVVRVIHERWDVDDGAGGWRSARLGDITILVPARTSMPFLEDALERAGIPFRAESSSLVYASRVVRDLMMVVRAVADPTNYLHIVSALRTPLLACGDDDLFRFKVERRGHWSYFANQPETVSEGDPVRRGLEYLRAVHDEHRWRAPSEILDRIARDRRALELGFTEGRPRDVWRRLRFVIDEARGWSESTGGNLRQYLAWVDLRASEGARVAEAILPETDDNAVRIMTIHAAKGLEFPVTIVSGMSTVPGGQRAAAQVVFPATGGVGYYVGKHVQTDVYEEWKPIDEQMSFHERIRLLYVACTRARDHLVVSLHRAARAKAPEPIRRTNAELLVAGMGALLSDLPDAAAPGGSFPPVVIDAPPPPPPFAEWNDRREMALRRASRPRAVAATALTDEGLRDSESAPDPGAQKRPRDLDLPPWLKGRYGTAIGRAVHGVLQTIDLATGEGLDDAVAAQCEAEAVTDRTNDVKHLALAALKSPTVREASVSPHWREVYACTPVDDRLLEGYIDLLYRGPDGLVVVDHKTAATSDAAELDRRVEGYRVQGASYALTVAAATGEPVVRVTFVFLTPHGAIERHLSDLGKSLDDVRRLVAAGREVVTA